MATVPDRLRETSRERIGDNWAALTDFLAFVTPWMVLVGYGLVALGLAIGGAIAAQYLARAISGVLGAVFFLTVGLTILHAGPVIARKLFIRTMETIDESDESS